VNKELLIRIEQIFNQKLEAKTSWGRNDVKDIYKQAVNEALMELLN